MTAQAYPIVAIVQVPNYLHLAVSTTNTCLNGLSIIGAPTLGLVANEYAIIV